MNEITSYIKLICIVSIVAGVLMSLIPKGKLKGSFVSLCAVITISAMVLPLNNIGADSFAGFELNTEENSNSLSQKTYQTEKQVFEAAVAVAIEDNLKKDGIIASVKVEGAELDGSVVIKTIRVKGSFDSEGTTRIKSILSADFGEAEIIVEEDTND